MAHRKTVRHFHEAGHLHELTFSCDRRMPLLTNDTWREKLARCLEAAGEETAMELVGFVFTGRRGRRKGVDSRFLRVSQTRNGQVVEKTTSRFLCRARCSSPSGPTGLQQATFTSQFSSPDLRADQFSV